MRIQLGVASLLFCVPFAMQAQKYHVVDHWKIGGEGGWDYLLSDDAAHRLYITHGTRVEVLNTLDGKQVGAITGLKGTHGIALNPDGKTGYISDGVGNAIVVFSRETLAVIAKVPAGANPDGIAFEPVTNTVWAFNGKSHDASVMDAVTNTVIATIALGGKPEFPQVDGKGNVYVNIEDKNSVVALNAFDKHVTTSWDLSGCEAPSGMAVDLKDDRLFSVCDEGKMAISNLSEHKLIGLAPIGDSPDAAAYNAASQLAFSSNGEGTLTVIDASKKGYPVWQTVTTLKGARTMAYEAAGDRIFLSAAKLGATPPPTESKPHPKPSVVPGSFEILVVAR